MLTEISGHVSFPNGVVRINLTGLTDWQVPYLRSVLSVIPPSLQIYALRVAGIEEGSAFYLLSIPHIDTGGDNLAVLANYMSYLVGVATGTGPTCNGTPV